MNWKKYEYMVPATLDAAVSASPVTIPANVIALMQDWGGPKALEQLEKRKPDWYDAVPGYGHYQNAKQRTALADAMGRSDEPVHEFAGKLADTLVGGAVGAGVGAWLAPEGTKGWGAISGGLIGGTIPNLIGTAIALLKSKRSVEQTAAHENSPEHKIGLLTLPGYGAYSWASSVKTANNLNKRDKEYLKFMSTQAKKELTA